VPFDYDKYVVGDLPWDGAGTTNNNVPYEHAVVQDTWATNTVAIWNGITAADAKRFFDQKWTFFRPVLSAGAATPAFNCMGFAFGRNHWVNDAQPFYAEDYNQVLELCTPADIADYDGGGHVVLITDIIDCCDQRVTQIQMKDRGSAIFTYNYGGGGWDGSLAPIYVSVEEGGFTTRTYYQKK
jgi:hypothetical protein